jgi:chlorite dismutase
MPIYNNLYQYHIFGNINTPDRNQNINMNNNLQSLFTQQSKRVNKMNKADKEFNKERMDTTASTGSSSSNSSDKNYISNTVDQDS